MKKILKSIIIVIFLTFLMGCNTYYRQDKENKYTNENFQEQIDSLQSRLNQLEDSSDNKSVIDVELVDNKSDWKLFEDEIVGFSFRHPKDLEFIQNINYSGLSFFVTTSRIDFMDNSRFNNTELALSNIRELSEGNFGGVSDFVSPTSKKVRNLGPINAQDFMVSGRFEVCDVVFERSLVFYHNNHKVKITLFGDKEKIIKDNPKYFMIGEGDYKCGDFQIWNPDYRDKFYLDLKNNLLSGDAQEWFNLFDDIVDTIKIK